MKRIEENATNDAITIDEHIMFQQPRLSSTRLIVQLIYGSIQMRCGTWCWVSLSLSLSHSVANTHSRLANCSFRISVSQLGHQVIHNLQQFCTLSLIHGVANTESWSASYSFSENNSVLSLSLSSCSSLDHHPQSPEEGFPSAHNIQNLQC